MASDMLSSLPIELLFLVVAHLEWDDYAACRLTCRRIEAAMFPSFARDSFKTCCVMRTPESMQTLIEISKSRLSTFVTNLIVSSEVLRPIKESSRCLWPSGSLDSCLTTGQEAFISTGCDRDMLTKALLNLQRVRWVTIRNGQNSGKPTMPGDSSDNHRSLGLRKLLVAQEGLERPGVTRQLPTHSGDDHSDRVCLYTTLLALGKANVRPKGLQLGSVTQRFNRTVLHVPDFLALSVSPILAKLDRCILHLSFGTSVRLNSQLALRNQEPRVASTYDLRTFLQRVPRLKVLGLDFKDGFDDNDDHFVEWLTSAPFPEGPTRYALPHSPPAVAFDGLQDITLHNIRGVHFQALVALPRKFAPNLRHLRLWRIELIPSLPGPVSTPRAVGSLWAAFLESLKIESSSKLQGLCLAKVKEADHVDSAHYDPRDRLVSFAKGQGRYRLCAYFGPAMKHAVEAMIHYIEGDSSWDPSTREGTWTLDYGLDEIMET